MIEGLKILRLDLLRDFRDKINFDPLGKIISKSKEVIPFDYFQFYTSASSVYSSKIEGEDVDVDS